MSCGTVKGAAQPGTLERVFIPRAPRGVASPVVDESELRKALEESLPYVNVEETTAELRRLVADPRFHGRRFDELRVVLAGWGSGPVALEEIGRGYRAFCAATRRANCLQGPLTDSGVYEIAFDFAMGTQWDGFVRELKATVDPATIRIVLLTGLVIFMATIAIPELTSKIPAAIATAVLTAYIGARAVCDLVFGWIQMVRELDAARTFDDVRAAGQRYGILVGAQTARVLILLATAAIAEGGLIARLMKLPRATQASAALAAETGGVGLEAVTAIKEAHVLQSGVAITVESVAKGAVGVAMASHGARQQPGGRPLPGTVAERLPRGVENRAAFNSFNEARNAARKLAGLGDDAIPFVNEVGPLKGRVTGSMSPDGLRGWRLDFDSKKGFHVNWWDRTGGARRDSWLYGSNSVPGKSYDDFLQLLEHGFPDP